MTSNPPNDDLELEPFGDPDGSRADIEDVLRDFVGFEERTHLGGIAVGRSGPTRTRVLIGGKGAGKSVYLRRYQAHARSRPDLYADVDQLYAPSITHDLPSSEMVVKVAHWFGHEFLTEQWAKMWRRAIMRSLASHLLCSRMLSAYVAEDELEALKNDFSKLLPPFSRPLSIYSQLRHMITAAQSGNTLSSYLERPEWDELEVVLAAAVATCPPVYFYIDAIDEEFAHAPMYWLMCQKGLFYEVMRLLRDQNFGGRLHVVICIRDLVYSSVLRSEHRGRYRGSQHLRLLSWDESALRVFLREKIDRLDASFRARPRASPDVPSWLGIEEVFNADRKVTERVTDYLLRHTRLMPRDLILIGNRLAAAVRSARLEGRDGLDEAQLRAIVADEARNFGEEQLTICANQIAADQVPSGAAAQNYSEFYTGSKAYTREVSAGIKEFLRTYVADDRLDNNGFIAAKTAAHEFFEGQTDLMSVLWQNGLLGYAEGEFESDAFRFYRISRDSDEFLVPNDKPTYVLHSCLIDTLGLRPIGTTPVFPGRRASHNYYY